MKRTRRPSPDRRVNSSSSPEPGFRDVYEQAEGLREEFDEAGGHVGQLRQHAGAVLGPVREIPMSELLPGVLGWERTVRWLNPMRPVVHEGQPPDATLYLVILPDASEAGEDEPLGSPLRDIPWDQFTYSAECSSRPRAVLLARASSPAHEALARRFAEDLRTELSQELRGG
jgi:hypothetical protein